MFSQLTARQFARAFFAFVCYSACLVDIAIAQEGGVTPPAPIPKSPELIQKEADAALAKAKLDAVTAEMEMLKLKLGTIDTTQLPKGMATATDMELEGQLRAYAAAKESIDSIVGVVCEVVPEPRKILLATDAQLVQLNQYHAFLAQMRQLKENTDFAIASPPQIEVDQACGVKVHAELATGAALIAINSALTVAALFKTDVDVKGKVVNLNEFAVTSLLLKSLKERGIDTIYPAFYYILPPSKDVAPPLTAYKEVTDLKPALQNAARSLVAKLEEIRAAHPKPNPGCAATLVAIGKTVEQYVVGVSAIEKSIDEIGAGLTKQEGQSGLSLLSSYLVSERIANSIQGVPVLQVKAIAAGGETQTQRNWFKTSIWYGGGSILSFQLFSQTGELLAANTIPWYAGLQKAEDFKAGPVSLATGNETGSTSDHK